MAMFPDQYSCLQPLKITIPAIPPELSLLNYSGFLVIKSYGPVSNLTSLSGVYLLR